MATGMEDSIADTIESGRPIFLVGFMGAGKTTVGKVLAKKLKRKFIDLDALIEEKAGRQVAEIFAQSGEQAFRELERETIRSLEGANHAVVALGGGCYVAPANRDQLRGLGVTIWIDCPIGVCWSRISSHRFRPLLGTIDDMEKLLAAREPAYREADIRIQAGKNGPDKVALAIIEALRRSAASRLPF